MNEKKKTFYFEKIQRNLQNGENKKKIQENKLNQSTELRIRIYVHLRYYLTWAKNHSLTKEKSHTTF